MDTLNGKKVDISNSEQSIPDFKQSISKETVLGTEEMREIPEESIEDLERQADENYFEMLKSIRQSEPESTWALESSPLSAVSMGEVKEAPGEETEFDDPDLKIPDKLVAEVVECKELMQANRVTTEGDVALIHSFELDEMEIEEESDSAAEETRIVSDFEFQQSQEELLGSRKEKEHRRPISSPAVVNSSIMPKPSIIIDEGRWHRRSDTAEFSRKKGRDEPELEHKCSRETEYSEVRQRSRKASASRDVRHIES